MQRDNFVGGAAMQQRPDRLRCRCLIAPRTLIPLQAIG
jgi:hypothetical protein